LAGGRWFQRLFRNRDVTRLCGKHKQFCPAGQKNRKGVVQMKNNKFIIMTGVLAVLLTFGLAFVSCDNGTPGGGTLYYVEQYDVTAADHSSFVSSYGTPLDNETAGMTFDEVEQYWANFESSVTGKSNRKEDTLSESDLRQAFKSTTTIDDTTLDAVFALLKTRGNIVGDVINPYVFFYIKKL
jgi:hypothetical protein